MHLKEKNSGSYFTILKGIISRQSSITSSIAPQELLKYSRNELPKIDQISDVRCLRQIVFIGTSLSMKFTTNLMGVFGVSLAILVLNDQSCFGIWYRLEKNLTWMGTDRIKTWFVQLPWTLREVGGPCCSWVPSHSFSVIPLLSYFLTYYNL